LGKKTALKTNEETVAKNGNWCVRRKQSQTKKKKGRETEKEEMKEGQGLPKNDKGGKNWKSSR